MREASAAIEFKCTSGPVLIAALNYNGLPIVLELNAIVSRVGSVS
jgi:hypothetical protein